MNEWEARHVAAALPGWLTIGADGVTRRADDRACDLLGIGTPESAVGHPFAAYVEASDRARLPQPPPAPLETWSGMLAFSVHGRPVPLELELIGLPPGQGWLARLHSTLTVPRATSWPTQQDPALAVADALADIADVSAAMRAALQSLDYTLSFDFGCILRFEDAGATVLAAYPAPMAGIATGQRWLALDAAEAAVRDRGEPAIDGMLTQHADATSRTPLARLAAFGMRSRLHLPLFADATVVGCVILYRRTERAFGAREGTEVERVLRRLGSRIAAPHARAAETTGTVPVPAREATADALAELVADVAHELNNPLTSVLGYAQILETLEGEDRRHALRTIEEESLRAARIVRNLLAFARPVSPPDKERQLPLEAAAHASRVLVVEDEAPIRLLTAEVLHSAGYRVATAEDGTEAVTMLEGEPFDAVVTDMKMRGMDGAGLATWIATHRPGLYGRVIFVTGDPEAERQPLPTVINARFLEKPFDTGSLLRAVHEALAPAT